MLYLNSIEVSSKEGGGLEPIMNPREAVRANYESLIR